MKSIAIIGTDTNVGKTIVTAGIYNSLKKLKLNVEAQKWISTGDTYNFSDDLKFVYQIEKLNNAQNIFAKYNFNIIIQPENNPYSFKIPCSPHLAQKLENKKIQISKIIKSYNYFQDKCDFLLIETAGGLFSPLNEKYNFADLLKKLNLPVILVIKNVLGAINQTMLNYHYLKSNKIKLSALVFNNYFSEKKYIQTENINYLLAKIKPQYYMTLNKIQTKKSLLKNFTDFSKALLRYN